MFRADSVRAGSEGIDQVTCEIVTHLAEMLAFTRIASPRVVLLPEIKGALRFLFSVSCASGVGPRAGPALFPFFVRRDLRRRG